MIQHIRKYTHFSDLQKKLICKEYFEGVSTSEISRKFNASNFFVYKIVKDFKAKRYFKIDKTICLTNQSKLSLKEMKLIGEYVRPPQIPLTINSINEETGKVFGSKDRKRGIKLYLKNWLNYSYKKGGADTLKRGSLRTKYLQSIFSASAIT